MKSRKEIKNEYKITEQPSGVFCIKNKFNGKIFIGNTTVLNTVWNSQKFKLNSGSHPNRELQKEWNELGKNAFEFEIISVYKPEKDTTPDLRKETTLLAEMFIEELLSKGSDLYNKKSTRH